jgi:hypothetical protein
VAEKILDEKRTEIPACVHDQDAGGRVAVHPGIIPSTRTRLEAPPDSLRRRLRGYRREQ